MRSGTWKVGLAGSAVGLLLLALLALRAGSSPTRLTFLAVGQGDCAVFQHDGRAVLIDAGPKTDTFDAGERIVTPELGRLGVGAIDIILLSHPDSDHVGGLPALAQRFAIGRVVIPALFRNHPEMLRVLRDAGIAPDRVTWLESRLILTVGRFNLRLDAPPPGTPIEDDNDGSMFVYLAGEGCSALFTGDAGFEAETRILRRAGGWDAQLLKAGHHGSRHSTGMSLLRAVGPRCVVFSCGRTNSYGHPSVATLRRVEGLGVEVARTDRDGSVAFVPSPSGFCRE